MITLTIAQLTIQETRRRRILWVALALGAAFLVVFGLGFHYLFREVERSGMRPAEVELTTGLLLTAGLYATNFLIILVSVVTSVTAVSGEIESHTVEVLLTKPVRRWELILGKWLGFALLLCLYILLLTGSLLGFVYLRTGILTDNVLPGLGLMVLQGLLVLSLTIAGGTRLSSLANGVLAFMLYGIAFVGGWIEEIGAFLRNETAVDIGILTSLLMPSEIIWRKALAVLQPRFVNTPYLAGPFSVMSQPSDAMIAYAVGYLLLLLALAIWSFSRRDL